MDIICQASLLPDDWDIPKTLRDRLGEGPGRQRIMQHDGHLLLVLHSPPRVGDRTREGRFLWRAPDGTWRGTGPTGGPSALFDLLEEYEVAIEKINQAEVAAVNSTDYFEVLNELSPLARSTRNLHEALKAARKAESDDRRIILARDRAYALHRRAELIEADAKHALDFAIARKAEEQAAASRQMAIASHRLNLLVAFFFPIATLCSIFSTGFRHGLREWDEATKPLGFLLLLTVGLVLGSVLTYIVTQPRNKGR